MTTIRQTLRFGKLHPDAKLPTFGTPGSACFDFYALVENPDGITIPPGGTAEIRTGLKTVIPPGYRLDMYGRSGAWFKRRLRLGNAVGKIDEDYSDEIMISLHNEGAESYTVTPGERIAQGELNVVIPTDIVEIPVEEIQRVGERQGGLGSTGTH